MMYLIIVDASKENLVCVIDDQAFFKAVKLELESLSSSSRKFDSSIEPFGVEVVYSEDPFSAKKILLSINNPRPEDTVNDTIKFFTNILKSINIRMQIHPDLQEELDSATTQILYKQTDHNFTSQRQKFKM